MDDSLRVTCREEWALAEVTIHAVQTLLNRDIYPLWADMDEKSRQLGYQHRLFAGLIMRSHRAVVALTEFICASAATPRKGRCSGTELRASNAGNSPPYIGRPGARHRPRALRAPRPQPNRLSIPAASQGPSWHARHRFTALSEDSIRSRLLL